jgi:hypothetical protein
MNGERAKALLDEISPFLDKMRQNIHKQIEQSSHDDVKGRESCYYSLKAISDLAHVMRLYISGDNIKARKEQVVKINKLIR